LSRQARPIEIEAFVHDGANGAVLARRRFQTQVSDTAWFGSGISLRNIPTIGTRAFRKMPFGEKWTALIEDIARWAGAQTSCLPFIARIVKVEGRLLQLDAGAESRSKNQRQPFGAVGPTPLGRGFSPLENGYGRNPGRGQGLNLRAFLTAGVSNRSSFYDEKGIESAAIASRRFSSGEIRLIRTGATD
jgi:hypothetical protein